MVRERLSVGGMSGRGLIEFAADTVLLELQEFLSLMAIFARFKRDKLGRE